MKPGRFHAWSQKRRCVGTVLDFTDGKHPTKRGRIVKSIKLGGFGAWKYFLICEAAKEQSNADT